MTREDIISMAREADSGFDGGADADGTMTDSLVGIDAIIRFAEMVAAAERESVIEQAIAYGYISESYAEDFAHAMRGEFELIRHKISSK